MRFRGAFTANTALLGLDRLSRRRSFAQYPGQASQTMTLSSYELSRLDNMAQNQRKLKVLGLMQEPAAQPQQAKRRRAAPELVTVRRASERRSEASPRRYDTLHLFGRDVAEWPLPGVRRTHTLLVVRLVLRGQARVCPLSTSRLAAPRSQRQWLHRSEAETPHEDGPVGAGGAANGTSQGQVNVQVTAPPQAVAPVSLTVWV